MSSDTAVVIGKIQGTHGIRGELRVTPFAGDDSSLLQLKSVMLRSPAGKVETFAVASAKAHRGKVLLALKPFDNINQVLHLVGCEVLAMRSQLPEPEEDEYYWSDLLGLAVFTVEGEALGELVDIIETGSNDVYVVKDEAREVLIPAIEDVVVAVDLKEKKMTVSLPEGLLDL